MFFDKCWSDVSDDDIKNLASRLGDEMGGWIFHRKVDFSMKTPHMTLKQGSPKIINKWADKK